MNNQEGASDGGERLSTCLRRLLAEARPRDLAAAVALFEARFKESAASGVTRLYVTHHMVPVGSSLDEICLTLAGIHEDLWFHHWEGKDGMHFMEWK